MHILKAKNSYIIKLGGESTAQITAGRLHPSYLRSARKAAGSTSGSSISVEVVAIPPLNMASNTALPTARTNLVEKKYMLSHEFIVGQLITDIILILS